MAEIWKVVRYSGEADSLIDTKPILEELGFTNINLEFSYLSDERVLLYDATPPDGWTKEESGFNTKFFDKDHVHRATMRYKNTGYPFELKLSLTEPEKA